MMRWRRGEAAESRGEEGALLRLPPLSYCRCAVREQEGVQKGGEWKKRRRREGKGIKERLGSTATAAAAAAGEEEKGRQRGGKERLQD